MFEFVDELKDPVALGNGIVHHEGEHRRVAQGKIASDETLDARAEIVQNTRGALLLVRAAQDTDEDPGRLEVTADLDVIDAEEAGFLYGQLAAQDLADFAFEELADALDSDRRHGDIGFEPGGAAQAGMRRCAVRTRSQVLGHFLEGVALDDVIYVEVAKAVDADATLHAGADLVDFVLEPAEREGHALV